MSAITIANTRPTLSPSSTLLAIRRTGTLTNVALSGTYSGGTPTDVEVSWNGAAYTALGATIGGGNWSGTLPNQASTGQTYANGTLNVRWANDHTAAASCVLAIGATVGILGDSTTGFFGTQEDLGITTGVPCWIWDQADTVWVNMLSTGGGFQWSRFAQQLRALLGYPVFLIVNTASGTDINDYQSGQGTYTTALAQFTSSKLTGLDFIYLQLGSNSVRNASTPSPATYKAAVASFVASATTDFGASSFLHMMIADKGNGTWGGNTAQFRSDIDQLRQGILDTWANGTAGVGGNLTGEFYPTDNTHPDTVALGRDIAWKTYIAAKRHVYGGSGRGPQKATIAANPAKDTFVVTFDQALGNTVGSAVDGFRVMNGSGTAATITSATVTRATTPGQVTIVTSAGQTGSPTVSFASSEDAVNGTLPTTVPLALADTSVVSTISIPAEPFFNQAVDVSSPSASVSPSVSPSPSPSPSSSPSASVSPSSSASRSLSPSASLSPSSSASRSVSPSSSPSRSLSPSSSASRSVSPSASISPSLSPSGSLSPSSSPSSSPSPGNSPSPSPSPSVSASSSQSPSLSQSSSESPSLSASASVSHSPSPSSGGPPATPDVTVVC